MQPLDALLACFKHGLRRQSCTLTDAGSVERATLSGRYVLSQAEALSRLLLQALDDPGAPTAWHAAGHGGAQTRRIAVVLLPRVAEQAIVCLACALARVPFFRIDPSSDTHDVVRAHLARLRPALVCTTAILRSLYGLAAPSFPATRLCPTDLAQQVGTGHQDGFATVLVEAALGLNEGRYAALGDPGDSDGITSPAEACAVLTTDAASQAEPLLAIVATSGTTGTPKYVGLRHAGVLHRLVWHAPPSTEAATIAVKTSVEFVDSLWELFAPLAFGCAAVYMPDEALHVHGTLAPELLAAQLRQHSVTHLVAVPSVLLRMAELPGVAHQLGSLRHVISSGDTLTPTAARRIAAALPRGASLLNLYGSTETTGDALACTMPQGLSDPEQGDGALCLAFDEALPRSGWAILPGTASSRGEGGADASDTQSDAARSPRGGRLLLRGACIAAGYLDLRCAQSDVAEFCSRVVGSAGPGDLKPPQPQARCTAGPEALQPPRGPERVAVKAAAVARTLEELRVCDGFVRTAPSVLAQLPVAGGCDPPGAPIGNDGYELCFITSDMAQAGTAGPELLGRDSQIVKISGRFVNLAAIEATVQAHPGISGTCAALATGVSALSALVLLVVMQAASDADREDAPLHPEPPVPRGTRQHAAASRPSSDDQDFAAAARALPPEIERELRSMLSAHKGQPQPSLMVCTPDLPTTRTGKLDRRRAAEMCRQVVLERAPGVGRSASPLQGIHRSDDAPRAPRQVALRADPHTATSNGVAREPAEPPQGSVFERHHSPPLRQAPTSKRQRAARVMERDVLHACAQVLRAPLQHAQAALEPCTDLLALGATSMHVAAIAALLGAQPEWVYRGVTPRGIANELNSSTMHPPSRASATHGGHSAASSVHHEQDAERSPGDGAMGARALEGVQLGPLSTQPGDVEASLHDARSGAVGKMTPPPHCAARQSARQTTPCHCSGSVLQLMASDSRGEALRVAVPPCVAPQPPSECPRGGSPLPRQAATLTNMRACVDAPITVLEYWCLCAEDGCKRGGRWALACSHAGDVACVHVPSGARAWTAQLEGSPDAGGQVTACGRYLMVALLSGALKLLQISSGVTLSSLDSGGQLRRAPVLDPWQGLMWTYGHSRCISAITAGAPDHGNAGESGAASVRQPCGAWFSLPAAEGLMDGNRPHTTARSEPPRAQLRAVCTARVAEAGSTLVRFATCGDSRLVITASLQTGTVTAWLLSIEDTSKAAGEAQQRSCGATLTPAWRHICGSPVFSSATVVSETVVVATVQGAVVALAAATGAALWTQELGCEVFVDLAVAHLLSEGGPSMPTRHMPGAAAGSAQSTPQQPQSATTAPAVLVAGRPAVLCVVDARSGATVARVPHEPHGCASAACAVVVQARPGTASATAAAMPSGRALLVTDVGHVLTVDLGALARDSRARGGSGGAAVRPALRCACKLGWQSFSGAAVGGGGLAVVGSRGDRVHLLLCEL